MKIPINLVTEDIIQLTALKKVLEYLEINFSSQDFVMNGVGKIKKHLKAYNEASKFSSFLILTDLDDNECAPTLLKKWVNFVPNPNFIFRIAVCEVEAWLLADRRNFASFLGISEAKINREIETISDTKSYLINLARKSKREIREELVPSGFAQVGKSYNSCLIRFIIQNWDVGNASKNSDSLKRMINHLKNVNFTN